MQSTNEIRHHINAVHETRKISNAMELVSSARIKKVMQHIEYNRRYFVRVQAAMKDILMSPQPIDHPYLKTGLMGQHTYIVIAGDKGMVGAYNSDILDYAYKNIDHSEDYYLVTVGIMAGQYFRRRGKIPDLEITGLSQDPSLYNARMMVDGIIDRYDGRVTRSVYIFYTEFLSGSFGHPVMRRILPIRLHDYENIEVSEPAHEIIYVPSAEEVVGLLVPQYLIGLVFGALVQAYASEHFARMNTMQSATKNADELLKKLKLQYNIARQTAITQEIAEITGAAEVMNGK